MNAACSSDYLPVAARLKFLLSDAILKNLAFFSDVIRMPLTNIDSQNTKVPMILLTTLIMATAA